MENDIKILKDNDLLTFKEKYFFKQSGFFKDIFLDYIKSITIEKNEKSKKFKFSANVIFNEKSSNLFGITHGGGIITIIENLSEISLKYLFDIESYSNDININFLKPSNLNEEMKFILNIEKMGYKSFYIDIALFNKNGDMNVHANIIRNKMKGKF